MEMKPGYKQTEVGVIPEDWDVAQLSHDCLLISGHHVLAHYCNTTGDGVPYLTGPADFQNCRINQTKFTTRPSSLCELNDILVTVKGSGSGTIIKADGEYCISRQLMALRVRKWDSNYVYLNLLNDTSVFRSAAIGLIPGLSRADIEQKKIAVPQRSEQEAIAGTLCDADALIESLEQLIAKKRDLKQGAMQELLTGKKRLPGFEKKKGCKQTEVGAIPVDWEVRALGEIGIFKNGINKDRTAFGHGSPFVNLMDVFGTASISSIDHLGLIASTSFEQNTYDLRRGDVIFIRSSVKPSGVGLTVVVDNYLAGTIYSGFLIRFRDGGFIDAKFKRHCFYEEGFRQRIIGASSVSANTNINQDSLKRVPIILPPMKAEQKAIAETLTDMDAEIAALDAKLIKARQVKQGMMQELLTGRIRLV